jgi:hypothetical protein
MTFRARIAVARKVLPVGDYSGKASTTFRLPGWDRKQAEASTLNICGHRKQAKVCTLNIDRDRKQVKVCTLNSTSEAQHDDENRLDARMRYCTGNAV